MTWEVWVALLVTGIVAGFVVWLMEVGSKSLTMDTRDFSVVVWDTFGRPVQMRDYRLASVAGNTVGWVWSFLAFIVMSLYNAALTANMTIEQLSALPRRMSDLATLRVGSWVDYNESVRGPQCARPESATMPRSHSRSAPSRSSWSTVSRSCHSHGRTRPMKLRCWTRSSAGRLTRWCSTSRRSASSMRTTAPR